jgi:dipeptide transport system substrate-binding protein
MMGWTGDNGDPDNFFATLFSCAAAKDGSTTLAGATSRLKI